jgi:hypothetical protein
MRSKSVLALAAAAIMLCAIACGKPNSSTGASPPRDKAGCTALSPSGRSAADLRLSDQGSSLSNPTITVLVGNTTGLNVGTVTLHFPSGAPPVSVNGSVSAPVRDGQAILRLNPRLQFWVVQDREVPLVVKASGPDDNGSEVSAECDVPTNLAKLLRRVRDCFTNAGKRLYDVAITIVGSLEKWYFIIEEDAVEGGFRVPTRGGASSYLSEHNPTGLKLSQIRRMRVDGRLREVRTVVEFGQRYGPFGRDGSFKLHVEGPGSWKCTTNWISLPQKS